MIFDMNVGTLEMNRQARTVSCEVYKYWRVYVCIHTGRHMRHKQNHIILWRKEVSQHKIYTRKFKCMQVYGIK